jgi:hypothetical protein
MNEEASILNVLNDQYFQVTANDAFSMIDWDLKLYNCPSYAEEIIDEVNDKNKSYFDNH